MELFMLPISITASIVGLITGSVGLGFWVAGDVLSYSLRMIGLTRYPESSISESATTSEAIDFLSEFEIQYGKMHPDFVPESFTDAVQREFKPLLVYLHAPDHPDTPSFCKETLCSEALSAFLNENFVAWGDSITANEGFKLSKSLNASRFPFWAVIMAATGQSISLLRQSKEDQNQLEKEAESARFCEEKALSLGPEPEKGPNVTQVLVRLPNGERKGRRFHCNATLQSVYDFVDSSGYLEVGSYTLVTFFPRVLYGEDELSSTLEELGLYPQANLVELNS
ncbi:hypothetical protein L1987_17554 [Smallanthus sonchifolius]|uniref:Uncharacterized protein n=1 Tax=Smallanthus sonchifolius TaxID=185202 RepID=A0ACB9IXM0_9ASTR|nr:hypothetical protein L1987_17554 [Smallanthus sonchifolius]